MVVSQLFFIHIQVTIATTTTTTISFNDYVPNPQTAKPLSNPSGACFPEVPATRSEDSGANRMRQEFTVGFFHFFKGLKVLRRSYQVSLRSGLRGLNSCQCIP